MHLQSLCLVLIDRWRYLKGTLQPLRAEAAQTVTQRQLRQKMVKPHPRNDGETEPPTLHVARVSVVSRPLAPQTDLIQSEKCV